MAAPIADKIQLPLDGGNTGKKVRTQTRVIGADTVHEHFFVPVSARSILGKYKATSGVLTVPSAVTNGTTTGYIWFCNPVGSSVKIGVSSIVCVSQFVALAVDLLAGELRFSRFTFSGVGSAGLVTPAKRDSNDATAVGELRTASTGMSVSLGAGLFGYQYQTMDLVTGGSGHWNPLVTKCELDEDDMIVLRAGEGIVAYHNIAVTTANRRLHINIGWEEFE